MTPPLTLKAIAGQLRDLSVAVNELAKHDERKLSLEDFQPDMERDLLAEARGLGLFTTGEFIACAKSRWPTFMFKQMALRRLLLNNGWKQTHARHETRGVQRWWHPEGSDPRVL